MTYIKQWDLPCYPDDAPQPNRRDIVGLQKGSEPFNEMRHEGFHFWKGGSGIGSVKDGTQGEAEIILHLLVTRYLQREVDELQARLDYAQRQLNEWQEFPEQFAVRPD
jgi:hypothetical protein